MGWVIFGLVCIIAYLIIGIVHLIVQYMPWMYEDADLFGLPPSVYQHVAWEVVFLWPKDLYYDIKGFIVYLNEK